MSKIDPSEYAEFLAWKRSHTAGKAAVPDAKQPPAAAVVVKPSKKQHHSGFLLTINTNQRTPQMHAKYRPIFDQAIQEMLGDLGPFIVHADGSGARYPKYEPNEAKNALIEDIEAKVNYEIGGKMNQLHVHIPIAIKHRSNIQLNRMTIANFIKDRTGLPGVRVDVKGMPIHSAWDRVVAYAEKGQNLPLPG